MDKLPELSIVEDLATIEAEDDEPLNIVVEDLSQPLEPADASDIFIGKPTNGNVKMPTNKSVKRSKTVTKKEVEIPDDLVDTEVEEEIIKPKKKPLSEKQKAHLERIRVKALEAKKEKARLKKEIKEKVEVEVKQTRQRKKKEPVKEELSQDFKKRLNVPSDEEILKKKQETEQMSFINFMSNMEKYQKIRYDYESKKAQPKPQPPKPKPQPKPQNNKIPETIKPQQVNPYDSIFQW